MNEQSVLESFLRRCDRRTFLKTFGALGVGLFAGGAAQAVFKGSSVGHGLRRATDTRMCMGTFVTVTSVDESNARSEEGIGAAFDEIDRLIALLSRHESSSPVAVLNSAGVLDGPPPEVLEVLRHALHYHRISAGAFDITIKPVLDLFNDRFSREQVPTEGEIDAALTLVSSDAVEVSERRVRFGATGMAVTLDGIAKGYIVDRAAQVLQAEGLENFLINAGGDIRCRGERGDGQPWRVAVEDPESKRDYPDMLRLNTSAVATSGNYEAFYDEGKVFHHIVDPESGVSPATSASVSVVAPSAMLADALSTAAMVLPVERAVRLFDSMEDTDGLIVDRNGKQVRSRDFNRVIKKVV